MTDVMPYLEKIKSKFDDPAIQGKMSGFTKSIQLIFPDLPKSYLLAIEDGKRATLEEKTLQNPDITLTWPSDVFTGIQDKTVDATAAFMSGKLKVKGNMEDLMKLQAFMV